MIFAIAKALLAAGIPLRTVGASWGAFALGVLFVGEFYWGHSGRSERREDVQHGLVEVGLLTASAVVFFWILHPPAPSRLQPDQITVKFSDKVETGIVDHFQKGISGGGETFGGGAFGGGGASGPRQPSRRPVRRG